METDCGYYVSDLTGNDSSRMAVAALLAANVTPQNSMPAAIAAALNRLGCNGAVTIEVNGNVVVGNRLGERLYPTHRVLVANLGD